MTNEQDQALSNLIEKLEGAEVDMFQLKRLQVPNDTNYNQVRVAIEDGLKYAQRLYQELK